jgi:hypothetical protein
MFFDYQASEKGWLLGHSAVSEESPPFLTTYLFTVRAIHELPLLTFFKRGDPSD